MQHLTTDEGAGYDSSPLEVAEGCWIKLREPDMDVWLAFEVQDVPSEAIAIYP